MWLSLGDTFVVVGDVVSNPVVIVDLGSLVVVAAAVGATVL